MAMINRDLSEFSNSVARDHIELQLSMALGAIACPFCHGTNHDDGITVARDVAMCCDAFAAALLDILTQTEDRHAKYPNRIRQAVEMRAAQKMAYVDEQARACAMGKADGINCPWCGLTCVVGGDALCCGQMGVAVAAILERMEEQDKMDKAARILDSYQEISRLMQ